MNDGGQLRAAHLVLDYEPLSRSFQDVGNAIRVNDYRLARIDVSRPHFLAPHDLQLVDHPIPQGVPLAAQPIQQVPLGQAVSWGRNCIFLFARGRNWYVPIWRRNAGSRGYCYIKGRGRDRWILVHLNPCSYNYLRGGLFRRRSRRDGSKNWPKFEGTHEGEE